VLVEKLGNTTVALMSNGSCDFKYNYPNDGLDVTILQGHFDQFEKRETGIPSNNIWLRDDKGEFLSSIVNPYATGVTPESVKLVKNGKKKAFWYCHTFKLSEKQILKSAVKYSLVMSSAGPALLRQCYLKNSGDDVFDGSLFGFFDLQGTQIFTYNKGIWYDAGMAVSASESVCVSSLPYSNRIQLKRVSAKVSGGIEFGSGTCDYTEFIGNTASSSLFPNALLQNRLSNSHKVLNRFSTPTIYAHQFIVKLAPGESGGVSTSLLYVSDEKITNDFRAATQTDMPDYSSISSSFYSASEKLLNITPDVASIIELEEKRYINGELHPHFKLLLPKQRLVEEYLNSLWSGVDELYENCRAHGAKLADGIELGTRDRAQDMWSMMKKNPEIVRKDLVHLFSFMYDFNLSINSGGERLGLKEKLHGMFPRQYPSRWSDRTHEIMNDNRHYADSALWTIDSIVRYITETGDYGILQEMVETVRLTNPKDPVTSGMIGNKNSYTIIDVIFEILASFERHVKDSPYGMTQILYGGWNDPVDMFGTSEVGNPSTRGKGRGTCTSHSAHLFRNIVSVIDLCEAGSLSNKFSNVKEIHSRIVNLKQFADKLRQSIIKVSWENDSIHKGFVEYIHELNADSSIPNYCNGEKGYTLGSMKGTDFDGINRRLLTSQAWGFCMISTERDYLTTVPEKEFMQNEISLTLDNLFYDEQLGLKLFSMPVANSKKTIDFVGRIGIIPPGTAENGEYHHAQTIMHLFRIMVPGNADVVWRQFKPIISAMKSNSLNGPFEAPSTSYAADPKDPHFGAGMYFGLSGSMNWIIEIFEQIVGLELNLYDSALPDLKISPNLPSVLGNQLKYQRIIHYCCDGVFREIPFSLILDNNETDILEISINGKVSEKPEISSLENIQKLDIVIKYGS